MKSPYIQGIKQGFAEISVYSVDFLLGLIQSATVVGFEIILWTFVLPADSQRTLLERTSYFLIATGIALIIGGARYRFGRELILAIKEGTLSFHLLKPIIPLLYIYSEHIGGQATDLFTGAVFIFVGALWVPGFSWLTLSLFLLMLITAFINTSALNIMCGSMAFWTTEATGIRNVFNQVTRLLSGQQIPLYIFLEILPKFWSQFFYILPFASVAYTPTMLVMAKSTTDIEYRFIISSLIWAIILPITANLIWKKGLRRYEGTGN